MFVSMPMRSISKSPGKIQSTYNYSWVACPCGHGDWKQGLKTGHHYSGNSPDLDIIIIIIVIITIVIVIKSHRCSGQKVSLFPQRMLKKLGCF